MKGGVPDFREIILVTGTPGVGKTRFSNLLAKRLNYEILHLSRLLRDDKVSPEYDPGANTYIVDLKRASSKVEEHFQALPMERIVVEGHLSHLVVSTSIVSIVFVLRCHPAILRERLKRRNYSPRKIRENLTAEILDSCLIEVLNRFPVNKICEINFSLMRVDEAVDLAVKVLSGLRNPSFGDVDWISVIQREESQTGVMEYLI